VLSRSPGNNAESVGFAYDIKSQFEPSPGKGARGSLGGCADRFGSPGSYLHKAIAGPPPSLPY